MEFLITDLIKGQTTIMADLNTLTADVEQNESVIESAVALITNLTAEIKAAGTDPAALKALTDKLEASSGKLAAAVAANTTAAPEAV